MNRRFAILSALAWAAATGAAAQDRPSWTGRDVAATAQPLRVTDLSGRAVRQVGRPAQRIPGRPYGYRPARSIYVDPYGNVTTFVGEPPAWLGGGAYDGATPEERRAYGQSASSAPPSPSRPCAAAGGPATASAAIARAPNASGGGC